MTTQFKDAYHPMFGHVEVVDENNKDYIIKIRKVVPKHTVTEYEEYIDQRKKESEDMVKSAKGRQATN